MALSFWLFCPVNLLSVIREISHLISVISGPALSTPAIWFVLFVLHFPVKPLSKLKVDDLLGSMHIVHDWITVIISAEEVKSFEQATLWLRRKSSWYTESKPANYTVSQKKFPPLNSLSLCQINRFSKFLHCWKAYEICNKNRTTLPTSP